MQQFCSPTWGLGKLTKTHLLCGGELLPTRFDPKELRPIHLGELWSFSIIKLKQWLSDGGRAGVSACCNRSSISHTSFLHSEMVLSLHIRTWEQRHKLQSALKLILTHLAVKLCTSWS